MSLTGNLGLLPGKGTATARTALRIFNVRTNAVFTRLHCHRQNDSCVEMGSDESHFGVSLTLRDRAARQHPYTTTFEEKIEPKRNRTEVLGQTSCLPVKRFCTFYASRLGEKCFCWLVSADTCPPLDVNYVRLHIPPTRTGPLNSG